MVMMSDLTACSQHLPCRSSRGQTRQPAPYDLPQISKCHKLMVRRHAMCSKRHNGTSSLKTAALLAKQPLAFDEMQLRALYLACKGCM